MSSSYTVPSEITSNDIQLVQNLIEKCLQRYYNDREIIQSLFLDNITPGLAILVLKKLQQQNQQFFKAYTLRVTIKEQIFCFNILVAQQAALLAKTRQSGQPVSSSSARASSSAASTSDSTHEPRVSHSPIQGTTASNNDE